MGSSFSGTGAPTATLPGTCALNDILVLVLQTANDTKVTAPADYQQLGPQNGVGAAATAGSTKICMFWKRHDGSESAPTIPDTGDHTYGFMFAVRGCPTSGDPFHLLGQTWNRNTANGTLTSFAGATWVDACLITDVFAHAVDSASAQGSSPTSASLAAVTEQFDGATTDGIGGGLYMMSGAKAQAGTVAASTVTLANNSLWVGQRIAWLPANMSEYQAASRPLERQVFIGSNADLDDAWVAASGASEIFAQLCDGGGAGSGGNTTTTAAGGGGGGGGGYDEAWFRAEDLGASVTVHAGKGGNAGTGLNAAGNAGVVSEFGKGGNGPLTSTFRIAGTAATAAASADGGNGGCGSGRGRTNVAVQTTRLDQWGTNASRPGPGQGAAGGSGTTAPTGGGNADMGGGGGNSGADTDAAIGSTVNGWSVKGAGGGGGGRTNTTVDPGGSGGGAIQAAATQGAQGTDSTRLPFGGAGGVGGGSSTATGGRGGFPGGGGGGGGGVSGGFGGAGGDGCVVVTTYF